jgi:hypothetical protein
MAEPIKRFHLFFDTDNSWVFSNHFDTLAKAQHYTGLTVHCLIIDTETGAKYERLSPMGSWHEQEKVA